jgi:hypothetical protein
VYSTAIPLSPLRCGSFRFKELEAPIRHSGTYRRKKKCLLGIGPRYPLRSLRSSSSSIDVSVVTISLIVLLQQTISGVGVSYPVHSVLRRSTTKLAFYLSSHSLGTKEHLKYVNTWSYPNRTPADHIEASLIRNSLYLFLSLIKCFQDLVSYKVICRDTSELEAQQSCAALSQKVSHDYTLRAKDLSQSLYQARAWYSRGKPIEVGPLSTHHMAGRKSIPLIFHRCIIPEGETILIC